METKNRIPKENVIVTGAGQSDFGPVIDPWETAAYDLVLLDAGLEIANCNVLKYTSVIPKDAKEERFDTRAGVPENVLSGQQAHRCIQHRLRG